MIEHWAELVDVTPPFVTFRWTFRFEESDDMLTSDSTLRFRTLQEVEECVRRSGLELIEVRDARDRPGREFVLVCRRGADH